MASQWMTARHAAGALVSAAAIFFVSTSCGLQAQELLWSQNFGGVYSEIGYGGITTFDRGLAVVGSTFSYGSGDYDVYLLRLDSLGDTLWTRTYGGTATDNGHDLQQTPDSGFIIVGTTNSSGHGKEDVYVVRVDSHGSLLWSRTYGGAESDEGWSIRSTYDGGYIIGGSTSSSGAGYADVLLMKINSSGDSLWSRTYGGPGGESGFAVRQTRDSGFIVVGATGSFGEGYSSMYAVRTTSRGDSVWAKTYGGPKADIGSSVEITPDGGFIFVGSTASYGLGYNDAYLVKTDADGIVEWDRTYGGTKDDRGYSVCVTPDGGYLLAGTTESFGAGAADMYAVKTDPVGEPQWSREYGGTKSDYCRAVLKDYAGRYLLVGYSFSYSRGGSDLYLARLSADQGTPVDDPDTNILPDGYSLEQNYPNPFNLSTTIRFSVARLTTVRLTIFNILGQSVREWTLPHVSQGTYSVEWDGITTTGQTAASGVYLYRVEGGPLVDCRKMVLLK
jgi:hypothetical protein